MSGVPVTDRIWVLLRPEVLGDALRPVLERIVERAIRRVRGRSGVPEWEQWAEAWLSGDRSAYAAAAYAARFAADAAWSAAYAARSAADAARSAAYAARSAADAARFAAAAAADAAWSAAAAAARSAAAAAACDDERTKQLADIRAALVTM